MSSELFLVVDQTGLVVAANHAWETTLGWTAAELQGRYVRTLIHPDDQGDSLAIRQTPEFLRGETVRFVSRLQTTSGQWRWLEWQADYCPDDDLTYATGRDITGRREAEELLLAAESRHRQILENLPNAMVAIIDPDLRFRYLAGGATIYTGLEPARLLGCKVTELAGTWVSKSGLEHDLRLGLLGETRRAVYQSPDSGCYYDRTVAPMTDSDGNVTGVLSLLVDVTEQMESQRQVGLLAQVLDESGEAILSLDPKGIITSANRRACELYGYSQSEMLGMQSLRLSSPHQPNQAREILATVMAGGTWRGEVRHINREGKEFWAAVTLSGVKGPSGSVDGVALIVLDITDRKRAEEQLADANANFRQIVEHSPIGVALLDLQGRWQQVNPAICQMLGYTEAEMLEMGVRDLIHPEDLAILGSTPLVAGGHQPTVANERRLLRKDGSVLWAMVVGTLVGDSAGRPQHYVCQIVDISDRKRVENRLRIEADMDPLTETLNRRRFAEVLTQAITDAGPSGQLSLLFIDLDDFKAVNDTFGHPVGDELLKTVAAVLRDNVRSSDCVGRHGGDEFVVLLNGAGDQVARGLAGKLAELIAGIGIPANGQMVRTRASIGVAHVDARSAITAEDALILADRAMYAVKMRLPRRRDSHS
ncbi:MAG: hypothetical protein JWL70_944 [Acidimicrobiia bacterium]|nr:hypothetical protein [Acidimicrobiia bacterium]